MKSFDEISFQIHYFFRVIPVFLLLNVQMHISVIHFLKAMGAGKPGTLKVQLQNLIQRLEEFCLQSGLKPDPDLTLPPTPTFNSD